MRIHPLQTDSGIVGQCGTVDQSNEMKVKLSKNFVYKLHCCQVMKQAAVRRKGKIAREVT